MALVFPLTNRYNTSMKHTPLCILLAGLLVAGPSAYAQKKVNYQSLIKSIVASPARTAQLTSGLTDRQLSTLLTKMEQQNAALERQIATQQELQQNVLSQSRASVFRVIPPNNQTQHSLSGSLFKTTYQGQEEIYGAVPMHILRDQDFEPGMLSYKFTAAVQTPQGTQAIPAWVVQLSSSVTGDVALVKFRKEDEPLLTALPLSTQANTFPQQVYSVGYARSILTEQAFQLVGTTSSGILTAQIPAAYKGERSGYCGSPILNEQAQLAGVHIGSEYLSEQNSVDELRNAFRLHHPEVEKGDVGYVAPASFLQEMVNAYHKSSSKPITVRLGGYEITHLAVNEYVSEIELLDKDQNQLWHKHMDYKVSYSAAEAALRFQPKAVYVRVHIGKSHWVKNKKGWYVEDTPNVSSVLYPLPPAVLRN